LSGHSADLSLTHISRSHYIILFNLSHLCSRWTCVRSISVIYRFFALRCRVAWALYFATRRSLAYYMSITLIGRIMRLLIWIVMSILMMTFTRARLSLRSIAFLIACKMPRRWRSGLIVWGTVSSLLLGGRSCKAFTVRWLSYSSVLGCSLTGLFGILRLGLVKVWMALGSVRRTSQVVLGLRSSLSGPISRLHISRVRILFL
jgi:hypothetical protein